MDYNYIKSLLLGGILLLLANCLYAQDEMSLNGQWKIIYDDNNEGREKNWIYGEGFDQSNLQQDISVPSCWEEFKQDYEGVAIYKTEFEVPAGWKGKNIAIQFGAVNYISEVYLNDEVVGYHKGGFTPFEFRVNKTIKAGEKNTLIVRVVSPVLYSDKVIDGIGPHQTPMWRGALTGGIWQDVSLRATDAYVVDDVFIQTDYKSGDVSFDLGIENTTTANQDAEVIVNILDKDKKVILSKKENLALTPGVNDLDWKLNIENHQNWGPKNPYLYTAQVQIVKDGKVSDQNDIRFGIREFTIKDKKYYLNGEEFYLKGAFFEGLYPTKLAYMDSEEMARKEIQLALDAGFNMIRPWRKPPPRKWLDLCDEMGVLTVGSLAIECMHRPIASPMLPDMVETEVRESILRDRNRTCVIQWELFNELWQPVLIQMLHPMALLARDLDPTRLVLDESGGFANGANIYQPYEKVAIKFSDIHTYPGYNFNDNAFQKMRQVSWTKEEKKAAGYPKLKSPGHKNKPGAMVFVSEIGYGSLPDLEANNKEFAAKGNALAPMYREHKRLDEDFNKVLDASGMRSVFPTLHDLIVAQQNYHGTLNKRMLEASRSNYLTAGYCIHALSDGDWIIGGGIIDLWRNPKGNVYEYTKMANQPQLVISRIKNRNLFEGKTSKLSLVGINEYADEKVTVEMNITDEEGKLVSQDKVKADLTHGVSDLHIGTLQTKGLNGNYTLSSVMKNKKGEVIASNKETFSVFNEAALAVSSKKVLLLEADNKLSTYFTAKGIPFEKFTGKNKKGQLVIVGKLGTDDAFKTQVKAAKAYAEKGGTVFFTEVKGKKINETKHREIPDELQSSDNFPYNATLIPANGLWHNAAPIVTDHPVFAGLPTNQFMGLEYTAIGTTTAMIMPEGKNIVGVITHDRFPKQDKMLRNYIGVGKVYFDSHMLETEYGKGKVIYSTLNLRNGLSFDPVSQKIMNNILSHYGENMQ
ncbi:sugar-binding domain-containing protein [Flammeovirga sp. SubArs3]|uniref:glycoside hydrolase family 2 protein n=1 Tax=Flammeovirga sp. SubArs3 TaxID=2995316 RepID=UPI00248B11A7|nr:sugar-binding domain-containing protein [Flammeovirga sp. SubArs3]